MILHCVGCGKKSADLDPFGPHVSPLCKICMESGVLREYVARKLKPKAGDIQSIPKGTSYAAPPSALVHIHEDLYVDAAKVVSVLAAKNPEGHAYLRVVYQEHDKQAAGTIFHMASLDEARQLARAIVERVNAGRMPQAQVSAIRKGVADECDCVMCVAGRQNKRAGTPTNKGLYEPADLSKTITNFEGLGSLTARAAAITHTDPSPPDPYAVGEPVRIRKMTGGTVMYVDAILGPDELRCRWTKPSGLTERATFRRDALEGAG